MAVIVNYALKLFMIILLLLLGVSCTVRGGKLQEYLVENSAKPEFVSFDVPTSFFDVSKSDLSEEEKEVYGSLKKLNVLMLRADDPSYKEEKDKVNAILKGTDFEELMTIKNQDMKGNLYIIGDENTIDEVILFGYNADNGFALVRILGDKFKPENVGKLANILQNSEMKGQGLSRITDFFKTDL